MKHLWLGSALVLGSLACASSKDSTTSAAAPKRAAWSYEGSTGPEHWADLDPAYALAKSGEHQSPVDIATSRTTHRDLPQIVVDYRDTSLEVLNNGHTVEDDYHNGGTLTVDGHSYDLAQFHFHSPSEHTIDGKHAPLEMHLVHKDSAGKLAVLGVLFREGQAHPELEVLWKHMPTKPGRTTAVEGVRVNASRFLPKSFATYRYSGSLTTPPCSEGVAWFIFQEPVEASAHQFQTFRKVIDANNRPTQPIHDRTITASK